MKFMYTDFYSWFTSLGEKLSNGIEDNPDFVDYYNAYFKDTAVCGTIFWTAIVIAVAFALLYYFGVCNFFFKLAKRWVWMCVLAVVFLITFFTTSPLIVGNNSENPEESTGIFYVAYETETDKLESTGDDEARNGIMSTAEDFRKSFDDNMFVMEESLPLEMATTNACLAAFVFIILSFILKRFTVHGSSIPV